MKLIIGQTTSVCPICLNTVTAWRVAREDGIFLEKKCSEHGSFEALIWEGSLADYKAWNKSGSADEINGALPAERGCPHDCGLCSEHVRATCCVLLEVTKRCNLHCPVCYASAGSDKDADPSLEQLDGQLENLRYKGNFNIQLSGGEPTVRDDLPEIIGLGKKHGFSFFQLNTNGLRLAEDLNYLKRLALAGLSCVFLQFDGLSDGTYTALRGAPLLDIKLKAIDNCREAGIGVVLVPTVVAGINDNELGAILDFALKGLPHIRGVHFQPASLFGRFEAESKKRLTIPAMLSGIESQTNGRMPKSAFQSGGAENSYCSFHASFTLPRGMPPSMPLGMPPGEQVKAVKSGSSCCSAQSRDAVARSWTLRKKSPEDADTKSLDDFIDLMENYTLSVSGMLFQDSMTLDTERLKSCYICELSDDGRLIPFCAYNLTDSTGNYLYRK